MTHKEFRVLAISMGADIVFNTAAVAVFKAKSGASVSYDLSRDALEEARPVLVACELADLAMATDKTFGREGCDIGGEA